MEENKNNTENNYINKQIRGIDNIEPNDSDKILQHYAHNDISSKQELEDLARSKEIKTYI